MAIANRPGSEQLWAVGENGLVLISEDEGRTWTQSRLSIRSAQQSTPLNQPAPTSPREDFRNIFFFDSSHGWILAEETLLLTTDGGQTWQTSEEPPNTGFNSYSDLHFTSSKEGWIATEGLFHTKDGGVNWQSYQIEDNEDWSSLHFLDNQNGWAAGGGQVARTRDGGLTWASKTIPLEDFESARDVFFVDPRFGWVLSDEGSILASDNGGETWTLRARLSNLEDESRLFFLNREHGWILHRDLGLLTTRDGGLNWAREPELSDVVIASHFSDQRRGWIGGTSVLRTTDGGLTWEGSMRPIHHAMTGVFWLDEQLAFAVDLAGSIFRTENHGESWKKVAAAPATLHDIHFVNREIGWAVGRHGVMLRTTDGGENWTLYPSDIQGHLVGVHFTGAQQGWVIATNQILRTRNGGTSWEEIQMPPHEPLSAVWFSDALNGWGIGTAAMRASRRGPPGQFGLLTFVTTDGGRTWVPRYSPPTFSSPVFLSSQIIDATRGFVFTGDQLLFSEDAGESWKALRADRIPLGRLQGAHFLPDARRGWAFDFASGIYATTDGGDTWKRQEQLPSPLMTVRFASEKTGCALGMDGSIFTTRDGGRTWANRRPHKIYLAPWYYLSLLLVLGLTWIGLRRQLPSLEQVSVADVLVSDGPVDASQYDALNLDPLAQAVSRFLRNENTQPPLTMAITGEWGSGKSSLMNLLRDDLVRHGFRSVSFNAWHHQKEEHLLASLLESIRRQAIPSLWARGGIRYRMRLLWIRGSRAWFLAFLVLFGIALYAGLFLAAPSSLSTHLAHAEQAMDELAHRLGLAEDEPEDRTAPAAPDSPSPGRERAAWITWLVGLGAVAETIRRGLRSFGIRPAQLLVSASDSLKLSALEQQLGFRSHFSREFNDVTRALHPRSMVILIDDLDRCRPENVSEILEAVNFLVSSGECVIVMGLDIDRVERAIGLAFRDVATEMLDLSSGAPQGGRILIAGEISSLREEESTGSSASGEMAEADELKLRRQQFARQYLEKLINIEVPIPRPSAEEFADLFNVRHEEEERPSLAGAFVLKAAAILRRWSLALLALIVLGFGFWLGFSSGKKAPLSIPATTVQAEATPTPSLTPNPSAPATPARPEPTSAREEPFQEARLVEAQPGRRSPAWLILPLALLLSLVVWRIVQAQEDIVRDSPEFIQALKIWTPFLFSRRNNPRAAKRFLNRVRYYAMFQRPYSPPMSPLEKLLMRLGLLQGKKTLQPSAPIPEHVLVALSAVQHCEREWLSDPFLYAGFGEYLVQKGVPQPVLDHLDEFRRWGSLEQYRESFTRISAGIRVT